MDAVRDEDDVTDHQRAQLIARGDPAAVADFVREHYPSVFRLMRNLTRSREDAEDLTQQAILRANEKIRSYRGEASLRTWVHRVAFFEYSHWRRRQRFLFRIPLNQSYQEPAFEALTQSEALLQALHRLPPQLREAFLLHEVQELSVEDVAHVTRSPIGTIKSRLHHARKRLRELLAEAEEIPDEIPLYESAR